MKIHLIAIGGSAMHNLAIALQYNHHTVTGSDDEIYDPARSRLEEKGLLPEQDGWFAEKIHVGLDAIILGMHARPDNPELNKAQELNLPIYSYPEFVYQHAKAKKRIVVAGSHGKTTTTAMILHALKFHSWDFDYLVGAQLEGFDNMVRLSEAPLMVIEGDEYLSSPIDRRPKFVHYRPQVAIITGIAWDHINVFPTFELYVEQFKNFVEQLVEQSILIYYQHDTHLARICEARHEQLQLKPYEAWPSRIEQGQTVLEMPEGHFPLHIFGQHNLENLHSACLACEAIGMSRSQFLEAVSSFGGAAKRMQILAKSDTAVAFQDFAHAPSKVKATIAAVKNQFPEEKLTACLELHTFSSLNKHFLPHYHNSMTAADEAIVYFADHTLEMKKLPPIAVVEVQEAFGHLHLRVIKDREKMVEHLKKQTWEKHNLLLMSSGTFGGLDLKKLAQELLT